jgi:LysM repeat protein
VDSPNRILLDPNRFNRTFTRREMLTGASGVVAAGVLFGPGAAGGAVSNALGGIAGRERRPPATASSEPHHIAWVWQFQRDGDPGFIRDTLAANGLGVAVKTHDGPDWMSRYDKSANAISGPARVEAVASFFENSGVPFHAWSVVTGEDPEREAAIASDVLNAGARSLFLDLEPHAGFWKGTSEDAWRFGEALRALQPSAWLSTSVDARPWTIDDIPLGEFATFTDELSPQTYWKIFSSLEHIGRYFASGHVVGAAGITADLVVSAAARRLSAFGLPIHPIGDGTAAAAAGWAEFVDSSFSASAATVSVWRFGIAEPGIWQLLKETPPRPLSYVVQPGDTLAAIAEKWGTTVEALVAANGIADPNLITVGTRLAMPSGAAPRIDPPSGTESYIVQAGDTLWDIAQRFGTSVDALMAANGLSDPGLLLIGQALTIP